MYKLVPLEKHCVVEVNDLVLPNIDLTTISYKEQIRSFYSSDNVRLYADYTSIGQHTQYLDGILINVLELMKNHPVYTSSALSRVAMTDIDCAVELCKDTIGYKQPIHTDINTVFMTGVVHITDCENPTKFYKNISIDSLVYTAPKKASSGAFWLNTSESYHGIDPTTIERNNLIFHFMPKQKL